MENENDFFIPKHTADEANPTSKRLRFWMQLTIQMVILLIAEGSRGLVLPSLFLYVMALGGDRKEMGFVVAAFSLGRLVGGILLGWVYNAKGTRCALLCALGISAGGHLLYALAQLSNVWLLLVARILVGFGTGSLSVVRAVIAAETTKEQRVRFMAIAGATQFVGFAIVPALALFMVVDEVHILGLPINSFTIPAYALLISNLILIVICHFLVKDTMPQAPEDNGPNSLVSNPSSRKAKAKLFGIILFLILNFVCRGVISLVETIGGIMYLQLDPEYDETDHPNNIVESSKMFAILGAFGLIFFFLVDWLRKCFHDIIVLAASMVCLTVGCLFLIPWGSEAQMWHFYVGAAFVWSISSPLTQTLVISSFSKLLESHKQGTMMGLIGAAGSVGRMVVPSISGFLSNEANFIVSAILSAVAAAVTTTFGCIFGFN